MGQVKLGAEAGRGAETGVDQFRLLQHHTDVLPRVSQKLSVRCLDFATKQIGKLNERSRPPTTPCGIDDKPSRSFVVGLRYVPSLFAIYSKHTLSDCAAYSLPGVVYFP